MLLNELLFVLKEEHSKLYPGQYHATANNNSSDGTALGKWDIPLGIGFPGSAGYSRLNIPTGGSATVKKLDKDLTALERMQNAERANPEEWARFTAQLDKEDIAWREKQSKAGQEARWNQYKLSQGGADIEKFDWHKMTQDDFKILAGKPVGWKPKTGQDLGIAGGRKGNPFRVGPGLSQGALDYLDKHGGKPAQLDIVDMPGMPGVHMVKPRPGIDYDPDNPPTYGPSDLGYTSEVNEIIGKIRFINDQIAQLPDGPERTNLLQQVKELQEKKNAIINGRITTEPEVEVEPEVVEPEVEVEPEVVEPEVEVEPEVVEPETETEDEDPKFYMDSDGNLRLIPTNFEYGKYEIETNDKGVSYYVLVQPGEEEAPIPDDGPEVTPPGDEKPEEYDPDDPGRDLRLSPSGEIVIGAWINPDFVWPEPLNQSLVEMQRFQHEIWGFFTDPRFPGVQFDWNGRRRSGWINVETGQLTIVISGGPDHDGPSNGATRAEIDAGVDAHGNPVGTASQSVLDRRKKGIINDYIEPFGDNVDINLPQTPGINLGDGAYRPAAQDPTESIDFSRLENKLNQILKEKNYI